MNNFNNLAVRPRTAHSTCGRKLTDILNGNYKADDCRQLTSIQFRRRTTLKQN